MKHIVLSILSAAVVACSSEYSLVQVTIDIEQPTVTATRDSFGLPQLTVPLRVTNAGDVAVRYAGCPRYHLQFADGDRWEIAHAIFCLASGSADADVIAPGESLLIDYTATFSGGNWMAPTRSGVFRAAAAFGVADRSMPTEALQPVMIYSTPFIIEDEVP